MGEYKKSFLPTNKNKLKKKRSLFFVMCPRVEKEG